MLETKEGIRLERKEVSDEQLKEILDNHIHWLKKDCESWEEMCANLSGADLRKADLRGADLGGANLRDVVNVPYIPMACPEEGEFIAFKKAEGKIVVLKVAENAKRSSSTTRKCRCSEAEVLRVENLDGTAAGVREVKSDYDFDFLYRVGERVKVDDFDDCRWNECSTGIHFFINRQEAVDY